jgi:hypothetical protein
MTGIKPLRVTLLILAALSVGCGKDRPKLVQASGNVTHKGEPLTAGSIIFHPDKSNSFLKDQPSSLLQLDGKFTMKTFPYGEGVSPGKYRVTLAPELAGRLRMPKLAKPETTPWVVEIPDSGKNDIALEAK